MAPSILSTSIDKDVMRAGNDAFATRPRITPACAKGGWGPVCSYDGGSLSGDGPSFELVVVEAGSGDDVVVLVHGVLDRGRSFRRVAEILATDFRVLYYDRRGYAAAADPFALPVDADRHITDLLAVLDGRPATVVGHSFGGVIALGAAAHAPGPRGGRDALGDEHRLGAGLGRHNHGWRLCGF